MSTVGRHLVGNFNGCVKFELDDKLLHSKNDSKRIQSVRLCYYNYLVLTYLVGTFYYIFYTATFVNYFNIIATHIFRMKNISATSHEYLQFS